MKKIQLIQGVKHTLIRSDAKRKNLQLLADYLSSEKLDAKFNMAQYCEIQRSGGDEETDCGSVGCAIGHGPYAGIHKSEHESWRDYGNRCFITDDFSKSCFTFLFSADWWSVDNTPQGAARRIDYVIEHGLPVMYPGEDSEDFIRRINNLIVLI